jgi:hypothetical protein
MKEKVMGRFAIASIVLGMLALLWPLASFSRVFRPIHAHWLLIWFVFGSLGILFGFLTRLQAKRIPAKRIASKLALAGIILGCISPIVAFQTYKYKYQWMRGATYSRNSRAVSEMRNLQIALEEYRIDHNAYPPAADEDGDVIPYNEDGLSSGYVTWMLTTPKAYIVSCPLDPYHRWPKGTRDWPSLARYRYSTNGIHCWILMSYGPDQDEDMAIEDYVDSNKGNCSLKLFLNQYGKGDAIQYDSTNGVTSSGDIIRVGP